MRSFIGLVAIPTIFGSLYALSSCDGVPAEEDNKTDPASTIDDDDDGSDGDSGKSKKKSSDSNDDDSTGQAGTLILGEQVADNLAEVNINLGVVQERLAPPAVGALAVSTGGGGGGNLHLLDIADEAAEIEERVKGTIEGTMRALGWIRDVISSSEAELDGIDDKAGSLEIGNTKIEYKFESKTKYVVRHLGGEMGNFHIEIDGKDYLLYRQPIDPPSHQVGDNKVKVTFTDDDNWTIRDDNTTDDCDANRPESISTSVERVKGVWYGKMVHGNGSIHNNCPVEIAGQNYTYFQFVGDEDKTTAAGYSDVPLEFTDFSTIEQYAFEDESEQTANPVCLEKGQSPQPQTACTSDNTDISTPNFGIEDAWLAPGDLVQIKVEFPSKIQ